MPTGAVVYSMYMLYTYRVAEARDHFADVLSRADDGVPVTVRRGRNLTALVDAERLRDTLATLVNPRAQVFHEGEEWGAYLPDIPSVSATGDSLDEVLDDLVLAAREYAVDWIDHLRIAPNHQGNWGFVQTVALSDDDFLRSWLSSER